MAILTRSLSPGRAVSARNLQKQIAGGTLLPTLYQHHPDDLIGLDEILAGIDRTPKWGYANNIIPIYNERGEQTNKDKPTPFPFEQLPPAVVKTGKKGWKRASVDAWKRLLNERADQYRWARDGVHDIDTEVD